MDNGITERNLEIFFAGAGMDGEKRYELHGLTVNISDLTLAQLHEVLRAEGGIPEETIRHYRQQIDDLSKQPAADANRPSILLPTNGTS
jgi:hypothetical protein